MTGDRPNTAGHTRAAAATPYSSDLVTAWPAVSWVNERGPANGVMAASIAAAVTAQHVNG